ncbi:hypothetical protein GIB67_007696 [Kingdonia uniflora]|uniref:Guanylyl cyclase n=1 Tax=Kingdonia uniflora TaxID=39325 RepID=A0A7J7N1L0_9MAGN|nr:hypothetical protein GIB67_007696 [Kingdonia uniflora]
MWPVYILANKFHKMGEESVREFDIGAYSNRQSSNVALPRSYFVEVPHIAQLCSWDCGLACVLMVLRTVGVEHCDIQALREICSTTSIWTVDLAYLLQKFSISFSFFTVTLGVNPDFSVETFYKEQLQHDLGRVDRLFQKALEAGINIQCRSISGQELSFLILSGNYIAIALVDQDKFKYSFSPFQFYLMMCHFLSLTRKPVKLSTFILFIKVSEHLVSIPFLREGKKFTPLFVNTAGLGWKMFVPQACIAEVLVTLVIMSYYVALTQIKMSLKYEIQHALGH